MLTDRRNYSGFFCGKPLWINLWRMWKSSVFPQLYPHFPISGPGPLEDFFCASGCDNFIVSVLRYRATENSSKTKRAKKFCCPVILASHVGLAPVYARYFL